MEMLLSWMYGHGAGILVYIGHIISRYMYTYIYMCVWMPKYIDNEVYINHISLDILV